MNGGERLVAGHHCALNEDRLDPLRLPSHFLSRPVDTPRSMLTSNRNWWIVEANLIFCGGGIARGLVIWLGMVCVGAKHLHGQGRKNS